MKAVVVQARTGSTRLPAKVLLPLGGMPIVVLVAKRAANTGCRVIVVTSDEPDDDALAAVVQRNGIECFRGSLNDTLGRFVSALEGLQDSTTVVRLTADNPFPDGKLIDEVVGDFDARNLEYLLCNGPRSGVPYGMSVEVTKLGRLREAGRSTQLPHDREHVTPYVRRSCGVATFDKYVAMGMGHFRCTVDGYDDYQSMLKVFADVSDPIHASALELCERLEHAPHQPLECAPVPKLVVGGAQLGMNYGIANRVGCPGPETVAAMLKCAIANGATHIDTAHAYADSEATIGNTLTGEWAGRVRIVTKLSPMDDLSERSEPEVVRARVDASVLLSCVRLRRGVIDVLLLHRASHLTEWQGAAWARLCELRNEGRIAELGVSVQSPEELEAALDVEQVTFLQLPFNILDWRWENVLDRLRAERSQRPITVHVRSALMQGLLLSEAPDLWRRANVSALREVPSWLNQQARRYGRSSVVDLCLAFVRSQSWVDGVVVGMETLEQMQENIRLFVAPNLTPNELAEIVKARPRLTIESLDPSCWSRA